MVNISEFLLYQYFDCLYMFKNTFCDILFDVHDVHDVLQFVDLFTSIYGVNTKRSEFYTFQQLRWV